jgi:cell division protein FtsI (penicillin-binding protein 3)
LSHFTGWNAIETATLAFGYGISVTALQLAQAYAVLAADGIRRPVTFLLDSEVAQERRVVPQQVARQVRAMLEQAAGPEGTAPAAQIAGYRVAGKTGTVHKSEAGGYSANKYLAVFAGMAPASDPRLVMVVMIDEPTNGKYYGGQVAAPVFSRVISGALRLLAVPPDNLPLLQTKQLATEDAA